MYVRTPLCNHVYAHYLPQDPTDRASLVCAYLALLPQALCVVYATLIFATREAEIALMFAGQLGCEALNFLLKRLIKEERPRRMHGKGYGMPSSHAQFVAFWSVSLALFLLVRHRPAHTASRHWSLVERLGVSLVAGAVAAATAWSRTYLNYHTTRQVLVGSVAGVVIAVGWFVAVALLRHTGWLAWALQTPLARALRVRDLIVSEDISQAGWERWQSRRDAQNNAKKK